MCKTSETKDVVEHISPLTLKNTFKKNNTYDNIPNINTDIYKSPKPKKNAALLPITYNNFIGGYIDLNDYIIPTLKEAAKSYKIRSSGKKQEIIDRITTLFLQTKSCIKIQTCFRGWICRYIIRLRGKALHTRDLCVNDVDFCTMEPIREIKNDYFYSFSDKQNIIYGFDITSLIEMFKRNNKLNPYTREPWSTSHINNIITLYNLCFILCEGFSKMNIPYTKDKTTTINNRNRRHSMRLDYNPITRPITREEDLIRYTNIANIRNHSIDNRINELFIEIDLLGNYTNREWFDNLELRDYIRLYRKLYEIWYYRGELSIEVQNNICPFYSPFDGIFTRPLLHNEIQLQQIKTACLIVIENMVYSGITEDYRKIGTLHALSALTSVSNGARMGLPWLYESIQN
jgi:hypothetical protein